MIEHTPDGNMALAIAYSKLEKLSAEIQLLIIENTERESLPAFILTSRRMHQLATPVLYRFVQCDVPNVRRRRPGPPQIKYGMDGSFKHLSPFHISLISDIGRFIETLERREALRNLVVGASLNITTDSYTSIWDPNTRELLSGRLYSDKLVARLMDLILPSLKYLEVKDNGIDLALVSSVPSASVEIPDCQMLGTSNGRITQKLRSLFQISTLRHITLGNLGRNYEAEDGLDKSNVTNSSVISLSFPSINFPTYYNFGAGHSVTFSYEPLHRIAKLITWARHLKRLHLGFEQGPHVEILHTNGFMKLLLQYKDTLEELFIDFRSQGRWKSLSAGLSMKGFTNLRRLGMAEAFLPRRPSGDVVELPTEQLWRLLPSALEELQLEISSAFENDLNDARIHWARRSTLLPTYEVIALNDSLRGILAHRSKNFPNLRYLILWCRNPENKNTMQAFLRRIPPQFHTAGDRLAAASDAVAFWLGVFGLPHAFREAGVRLEWSLGPEPPLFNPVHSAWGRAT